MNRIGFGRSRDRGDERLEARLEVAAVARAGEQRAEVEREDLGAAQVLGHVARVRSAARGPRRSRSCRRRSRRRRSGCSCAAARGRGWRGRSRPRARPADRACPRAARSVRLVANAVSGSAISSSPSSVAGAPRRRRRAVRASRARARLRQLRDAVRDVLEDVEPRHALRAQQRQRPASRAPGRWRRRRSPASTSSRLGVLGVRERVLDHAVEGERLAASRPAPRPARRRSPRRRSARARS